MKTTNPNAVRISTGNDKLGNIANVSLLPIVTCDKSLSCAKCKQCYAWRFTRLYPSTQKAWAHNTKLAKNVDKFFASLYYQLQVDEPRRFRWHVAGDCPTPQYVEGVIDLAEMVPETRFVIFTKRYNWWTKSLSLRRAPSNLSIYLSAWPGVKFANPLRLPVAWVLNPKEMDLRIPTNGYVCPGSCRECRHCWNGADGGRDVVFHKH